MGRTLLVPFQIDARGGLAATSDTRVIVEQQIVDILVTNRWERVFLPDYGADVLGFLFSPMVTLIMGTKAAEIQKTLAAIVSLADIVQVTMTPIAGRTSSVNLDVRYTIRPSSEVLTVSRTIDGLITEESI